jgi:hypothetical protein
MYLHGTLHITCSSSQTGAEEGKWGNPGGSAMLAVIHGTEAVVENESALVAIK